MDRLRQDLDGDWLVTAVGRMAKVTGQDHLEWKEHWNRHTGIKK